MPLPKWPLEIAAPARQTPSMPADVTYILEDDRCDRFRLISWWEQVQFGF